jgi:uncharacterized hydantoinase/oxoprolinase family protein
MLRLIPTGELAMLFRNRRNGVERVVRGVTRSATVPQPKSRGPGGSGTRGIP